MKTLDKTTDEIKNEILDAAFTRFGQYGFGKTTMAEIARDCDMSAGNLYRYYESKVDIVAGCSERCFAQKEELLREVLRRQGLSAPKRLEAFVLETLRYMFDQFSQHPLLFELVRFISEERMDLVEGHLKKQCSLLAEILAEGNKAEEFDVPDVLYTAQMIQAATLKFNAPHFMNMFSLQQMEKEAQGVVQLIVSGLAKH
ncbi:MAG: TetR/AcrR family transcriptional regulator [Nitrospinales bacterium]